MNLLEKAIVALNNSTIVSIAKSGVLSLAQGRWIFCKMMAEHPDDKPKTVGSFLGDKQTESGVQVTTALMILANTSWHLKWTSRSTWQIDWPESVGGQ